MDVVYQHVVYIKNNLGNACTVVFDGYQASTKDHEHSRRECDRAAAYTKIAENLIVLDNQQAFLKNDLNKTVHSNVAERSERKLVITCIKLTMMQTL